MLTPTEKFIFSTSALFQCLLELFALNRMRMTRTTLIISIYSSLFLFFSIIIIAMTLYLPQHIAFLTNRAWFYYNGPESTKAVVKSVIENTSTSTILVEKVKETVANVGSGSTVLGVGKEL